MQNVRATLQIYLMMRRTDASVGGIQSQVSTRVVTCAVAPCRYTERDITIKPTTTVVLERMRDNDDAIV